MTSPERRKGAGAEELFDPLLDWTPADAYYVAAYLLGRVMPDLCRKGTTREDVKARIDDWARKLSEIA